MKTQTAKLKYLKISPRKTRLVADLIKGLPANEAEAQLSILPNRASKPILKLLRSAMANAKNNQKIDTDQLLVKNIRVDIGPRQKRFRTRARGSSSLIEKKCCHIIMVLAESENKIPLRFKFIPKPKKLKKAAPAGKQEKSAKRKDEINKIEGLKPAKEEKTREMKPKKFESFKRIFRRKAI
ncbi:MAG: 50S ribosomal protein L22 [Patescibacteria group bacterium]